MIAYYISGNFHENIYTCISINHARRHFHIDTPHENAFMEKEMLDIWRKALAL